MSDTELTDSAGLNGCLDPASAQRLAEPTIGSRKTVSEVVREAIGTSSAGGTTGIPRAPRSFRWRAPEVLIAIDTGFLQALLDAGDALHARAKAMAGTAAEGWITTWPVLTETCRLLERELAARRLRP